MRPQYATHETGFADVGALVAWANNHAQEYVLQHVLSLDGRFFPVMRRISGVNTATKECVECGLRFIATRPGKKYCGARCRSRKTVRDCYARKKTRARKNNGGSEGLDGA